LDGGRRRGSLLVGVPSFLAFPIWLILLSNGLRRHFAVSLDVRQPVRHPRALVGPGVRFRAPRPAEAMLAHERVEPAIERTTR
jgi:hypothetical protein